ncbi:MAG: hypothetical protein HMLKMBBP_01224 [Planctomycetes bacterium]|nr:hypothetical protein [Planctomycetota bacterium]
MKTRTDRLNGLAVLRALRDGVDPRDGADLPDDHICQRPDVLRALCGLVADLERGAGAPLAVDACGPEDETTEVSMPRRAARPRAARSGLPWTDDEDRRLAEAFDGGATVGELAAALARSHTSIRARLIRLGRGALLGEGPVPRWPVRAAEPVRTDEPVAAPGA